MLEKIKVCEENEYVNFKHKGTDTVYFMTKKCWRLYELQFELSKLVPEKLINELLSVQREVCYEEELENNKSN